MLRSACALIAVLAAVLAWPAFAQDDDEANPDDEMASEESEAAADEDGGAEVDYHRTGPYVGLAGTWGVEKFDDADDTDIEDSIGINARAGYHMLSWLSAEVQGEYLFDFDIDAATTRADLAIWLIGGNLRLNLPTDLIQPYLLFGGGYMGADFSGDENDTKHGGFARVGGGVEFYPWEHIAIDVGLTGVLPVNDAIDDLDFISIHWGALYRF